jgi:hypothetical protein
MSPHKSASIQEPANFCFSIDEFRPMHSSSLVRDSKFGPTWIITERPTQMRNRSCQDNVILGNNFVPS